ncbi:hypothetical protein [Flavobacterium sp.]|uniref:hypothetical protein n=1 Tax=Flavobacterium sp. TaxID=239 RepID=UPI0011FDF440|nr:hypothetical protein [Flavobacterium sp.]RZJ72874.1 MAG: hypothetical protein EOO49_04370 [Flavobacterium sp.]
MKKLLLILAFAGFVSACGDDDSSGGGKVPASIVMTSPDAAYTGTYSFSYDNKNRLTQLVRTGAQNLIYVFDYGSNGKPQTISVTGDSEATVNLTYDNKKRLVNATSQFSSLDVTYTDAGFIVNGTPGTIASNGDLTSLATLQFNYDTSKKGAFANVKGLDGLIMAIVETNSPYYASKKAISSLTNSASPAANTTVLNTYEDGLPATTQVSGGATFTMAFTYN